MDFNNNEIKENIILYIAKPLSQSKYIENLVLSTVIKQNLFRKPNILKTLFYLQYLQYKTITCFSIYLLCERGFAIYSIIFSLISLLLKSILCSFQFDWCYSLFIGFMMILVLKYTLIVFRSNWWCPAGVKSILINKVVVYNLRLISYMPNKLVAILFYWSLNAKSSKFLLLLCVIFNQNMASNILTVAYQKIKVLLFS